MRRHGFTGSGFSGSGFTRPGAGTGAGNGTGTSVMGRGRAHSRLPSPSPTVSVCQPAGAFEPVKSSQPAGQRGRGFSFGGMRPKAQSQARPSGRRMRAQKSSSPSPLANARSLSSGRAEDPLPAFMLPTLMASALPPMAQLRTFSASPSGAGKEAVIRTLSLWPGLRVVGALVHCTPAVEALHVHPGGGVSGVPEKPAPGTDGTNASATVSLPLKAPLPVLVTVTVQVHVTMSPRRMHSSSFFSVLSRGFSCSGRFSVRQSRNTPSSTALTPTRQSRQDSAGAPSGMKMLTSSPSEAPGARLCGVVVVHTMLAPGAACVHCHGALTVGLGRSSTPGPTMSCMVTTPLNGTRPSFTTPSFTLHR